MRRTLVAALTCAALVLFGPLPAQAAVRLELPVPTGRAAIGTVSVHLVDRSRPDPWVPAEQVRELMIQVWYPARAVRGHPRAGWVSPGVAERINPPGSGFELPVTHGHVGAPAAPGRRPVVLFSPGFGLERTSGTALVEELVSHGFVVVTVDHTHDAQFVEFPGGRIAVGAAKPPSQPTPEEEEALIDKALDVRVRDVRFVLDSLDRRLPGGLGRHLDLTRVGMVGMSLGGATAADAMRADRRIDAGVDLDGSFAGRVRRTGLDRPFLMFGAGTGDDESWTDLWSRLRGPRYWLQLANARHLSFTDYQVLLPAIGLPPEELTPIVGTIDGERSVAVQRAYVRAFLDRHLRDGDGRLLRGPSPRYPEITFATGG